MWLYGMSLGHYVIVIAFHLIGSGDGIVGLMALHINVHAHYRTVQLYHDMQAVKKSYTQLKGVFYVRILSGLNPRGHYK